MICKTTWTGCCLIAGMVCGRWALNKKRTQLWMVGSWIDYWMLGWLGWVEWVRGRGLTKNLQWAKPCCCCFLLEPYFEDKCALWRNKNDSDKCILLKQRGVIFFHRAQRRHTLSYLQFLQFKQYFVVQLKCVYPPGRLGSNCKYFWDVSTFRTIVCSFVRSTLRFNRLKQSRSYGKERGREISWKRYIGWQEKLVT